MPPNLGGFFMVRSYYPSECHADYFDFERIEALKPAIEACGISTLSQSPMLGFHKQMDNRIKLLEEILSFRMQGVEFDNGDMYVDGHKAASDVRDKFVSVTEKLLDELAQCYNVLPQLDINNTIDHRPEGDEEWLLENEKTVTQFCRKLAAESPLKDIRDEYNYPKKKGIMDECSRLLEASTMKSRRGFAIQRLMNAMRQAHADGWFIVFDTLTLADDRLEAFYDNPNALRDYFRDIGRMVLAAEGRKANDSHADCYQYFCVPEYGTANGRLHFHAVHFMRTLPTGSVDPNFGRRVRNRRQLNSLQNTWPYGYSMPIAVRYTQDAFSRSGWLWPVDAKGEPLKATSYMAVGFYVAKYVNKKSDMDLAAKGLGAKEWNNSLKTKLSLLPKKLFRIRMSRNFGMKMLTMTNLSTECLIQLTKLGYDATPFNQILKQNAKREMRFRLGKVTVADVLGAQPVTTNLLKFMRASIKMIGVSNLQSFIASMTQKLTLADISDESKNYLDKAGITTACFSGMVDAGFENQKELTKMQLDNQKEIAEMQNETQKEIAGIQSATSRQNTKDQVYAQNEMLAYQQKESTARVASIMENTNLSKQQQVSEIMRQMLTQAQTAGQYFTNDQIKEMTRKVSAEVDLVHQQTQNQRYGSSHIGATAKDISNVVTDAASGVVDIFHGIDKAVADTWNNFWKDGKADGIGSNLSRK